MRVPSELALRAVSAVILAGIALLGVHAGGAAFAGLVMLIGVIMAWEWGRIVRQADDLLLLGTHALAIVGGGVLTTAGWPVMGLGAVIAGAAAAFFLGDRRLLAWSAAGVLYIGLPAVALIWMRGSSGDGEAAILFLFAIVWTTDTFSYVCGKLIGGPKLWPWLSPNKTWAGTIGGVVCAGLAALAYAAMTKHGAPVAMASLGLVIAAAAQAGDLSESALKRGFDVRNASNLIPGHGGFMDRMDGIVGAATVAAVLALVSNAEQPALALLRGL